MCPSATPNASNTTQYPNPVPDSDPTCCPEIHKYAPSANCHAAAPIATGESSGDARIRPMGLCARRLLVAATEWPFGDAFSSRELVDWEAPGKGDMGAHGLTGTGVGCVWSSPGGVCAPGSRKEKKLWDMECL